MDTVSKSKRSQIMGKVRGKDTKPEKAVRSLLHKAGYRFRLHTKHLPGSPDICMPKYQTVIFVHGCFWHRHKGCKKTTTPKSNKVYWKKKFAENIQRDKRTEQELGNMGWKVLTV